MAGANPYDIKKKPGQPVAGRGARVLEHVYTREEQKEKLHGYVEVPREHWRFLRYGRHVRYIKTDGEFKIGGFIAKNSVETTKTDELETEEMMMLSSSMGRGPGTGIWKVKYDDIGFLYAKMNGVETSIQKNVEDIVRQMSKHLKEIMRRLDRLEGRR